MLANNDLGKIYLGTNGSIIAPPVVKRSISISRAKIILLVALLLSLTIAIRLVFLNTVNNDFLEKELNIRVYRLNKIPSQRGAILDRNGVPLAVSTPVSSIWADPTELTNLTDNDVHTLAKILNMNIDELNSKLNQKNKSFVYLKRNVTPQNAELIKNLGIDGIYNIQEFKRFYPNADVTAHVIGFTNIDDKGSEGIEYASDDMLKGQDGKEGRFRDRQGNVVGSVQNIEPVNNGKNVTLSIDNRVQYIAYNALKKQVDKYHAKGGSVVVLDATTGEVLSMVNMPTFNPNTKQSVPLEFLRNRAAIDLYEPGSTIKPFVVAKALDKGIVSPSTVFDTRPYKVGPKVIHDVRTINSLTVAQILQKSSDVGVAKVAFKFKPQELWDFYNQVGFGQKIGTGFPGEAKGILRPWQKWYPIDQASMSYGYAISVSLMQMARAYTLFTNNGCVLPISFYKKDNASSSSNCTQVISKNTSQIMKNILSEVTVEGGTGVLAKTENYTTAGKTGTAHKNIKHGYAANLYVGSFVGFAPAQAPKLIIAVMLDEPHGKYYGGAVAAPVFSEIASQALPILGVRPDKK